MGLTATTTNLSYARNEYIKQGRHHVLDKAADMIWYALNNNDQANSFSYSGLAVALTGTARMAIGTSGTPLALSGGTSYFDIYTTCAATTSTHRSQYILQTQTAAATASQVEALRVEIESNVKTGAWANAIMAQIDYKTSGAAHGMAAAVCAEMVPPNSSLSRGALYALDMEFGCGASSSWASAGPVAFMKMENWGTATHFSANAFLFHLAGETSASGNLLYNDTLRVRIGTNTRYLILSGAEGRLALDSVCSSGVTDGSVLRMGTSGTPLTDDQAGAGFVIGYFDCGATSGWPGGLFISTNVTGAGGSFTALQGDAVLTAAKATVTGIENWMQVNTGGRVTGACRSVQGTIDFSNEDKGSGGVYSAACFNIKGQGSATDIGTTQRVQCIELKTEGTFSSTSGENFETKSAGYAIYFNGFTAASGVTNILSNTRLAELPASTVGIRVGVGSDGASGTAYYIPLVLASEWN